MLQRTLLLALFFSLSLTVISQTPCEDGFAGIYPCENVDMLSMMPSSEVGGGSMNDIWGWTDPADGTEYVLLCRSSGVSFIDISDPLNPVYLGDLPTHTTNSTWRDLKVYDNYAFVVSEAGGHGMQVFDLTQLSSVENPPVTFEEDAHYSGFGDAHNIVINPESGFAYGVGTGTFAGGLHIVNIQDPLNPVIAGDFSQDGYTHDAHVVTYNGLDAEHVGKEIAFACNQNSLTIVDCEDKTDCQQLSRTEYEGSAYAHQGWLTEDHRYFLLGDELDEIQLGNNTRTLIWDCEDLDNPVLIGEHLAETPAIDHNQYVNGNLLFQSNYRAGLRVMDLDDVANGNLSEVAFFDVYPANDNPGFQGSWSNYPYFESGVVAVTHIGEGLFLLKPELLELEDDTVQFCALDEVTLSGTLKDGFAGPIQLSASNLPDGASVEFAEQDLSAPATFNFTLSNFPAGETVTIQIEGQGEFFSFTDSLIVITDDFSTFYEDLDGDGFGSEQSSVEACQQPSGFVDIAGDCNDNNDLVFPDAPGTQQNIDNNCDGSITGDELIFCVADLDGNLLINSADVLILLGDIGCEGDCIADLDSNGQVSTSDILIMLSFFGENCAQ
ncbi:choice-of-anchor B family protein [Halocola ammonii]